MKKSNILPSVVLGVICIVIAAVLALAHSFTKDIIQANADKKTEDALLEVMPGHTGFTTVAIPENFPKNIDFVKKSAEGGYVFRAVTSGYESGLTVMIGIDKDGKIVNTKCTANKETEGKAKPVFDQTENGYYKDQDIDSFNPLLVPESTYTSKGYAKAVEDALLAFEVLSGMEIDFRTEEEKLIDSMNEALGLTGASFEKWFATDPIHADAVYTEKNGGAIVVIGETLVAFKDGQVYGTPTATDDELANAVEAYSVYTGSTVTKIDIPAGAPDEVVEAYISTGGTYVFTLEASGFGILGDPIYASGKPIVIKVAIKNGVIVSVLTVSESEGEAGSECAESSFYSKFVGQDKDGIYTVANISGADVTSSAYKRALRHAFSVFESLSGGSN